MTPLAPSVVLDLHGAQSVDYRDRGVAGYVGALAVALEALDPGLVTAYRVNPDLAPSRLLEPIVASGKVQSTGADDEISDGAVVHIASPIELSVDIGRLLPLAVREGRASLVVTLFDLVPLVLADDYLRDAGHRRRYLARLELLRHADQVITISQSAAEDAARLLELDRRRLTVVELAVSASFRPAVRPLHGAITGLAERFVLYTGGTDHRKNVEGLLAAWGRVPSATRASVQLVIVGKVDDPTRHHYQVRAEQLGFGPSGLLVTGWVADDVLVTLNQTAMLAVFPALYEGFGLPVVEALACGTPAVASNRSALPALLPAEALFDPEDADDMAAVLTRALTDDALRQRIVDHGSRVARRTWHGVATETAAVYRAAASGRSSPAFRPATSARNVRIAVVTPLPPQPTGVADHSFRMLEALVAHERVESVDAYVDGPPHHRDAVLAAASPPGVIARPLAALARHEAVAGRYDAVVVCLGNSEFHTGALGWVLGPGRGRAIVLAHDVRLHTLYRFARWQCPDAVPEGFAASLHAMYGNRLPRPLGADGMLSTEDVDRWGVTMARDAIEASRSFLVSSSFARELARLDASPEARDKIEVVDPTIGVAGDDAAATTQSRDPLIATFGVVDRTKGWPLLVEAFAALADRRSRLQFVGPVSEDQRAAAADLATQLGVADRIELTGAVAADEYRSRLANATIAVQLRTTTNGESSGAVADCLASGVPTVVSDVGAFRDLPDAAAVKIPVGVTAERLAEVLTDLLADAEQRRAVGAAARAYAAPRATNLANALVDVLRR